jgi:tetratricopeptide (TPR) repeat protein
MKRFGFRKQAALLLALICATVAATHEASAAQATTQSRRAPASQKQAPASGKSLVTKQERMDRAVDEMAVSSRETAILNLKRMLKLKRGTPEEPMLLWRLADMEWRSTKNYFRVNVSGAAQTEQGKTVSRYNDLLESCIAHTTEILTRFPRFKYIRESLVRRGRAFEELKKKDYALRDYLEYIAKYPSEPNTVEVRLMASDVLAEQAKHQDILKILKPVDLTRSYGGLEAQVVEKQALANFNVENYPEALRKAEWLLRYDARKGMNKETGGHYDEVVGMVALFYATAYEKRMAGYSLEHAHDYFHRLERGTIGGKLSHEFMIVMRSKEMQAEIFAWKDLAMKRAPRSPDTLWTIVDTYDAAINWKDAQHFSQIMRDFDSYFDMNPGQLAQVQNLDWYKKFKKTLLEYADKIYATLPKKDANENDFKVIQGPYLLALSTYMRITDPKDEVKARVRFRMGEFYAGMKDWDKAQQAFAEVYQAKLFVVKEPELREQAGVRAMTARYDAFKEKGIIPASLKAAKLNSPKKPMPADVAEWIKWVDEVSARKTSQPEMVDKLLFESTRVIYSYGDIDTAYKRMLSYIGTRPDSKLTPAVCALVIDTLIESEAWVATRTLAIKFQQMPNVAVGDFKKKLEMLERDSHFKITVAAFKQKDYPKAKAFGDEHLRLYPDSKYKIDIISMLGKASLEMKDTDSAFAYMNQVIELSPNHETAGIAFFLRASEAEKKFQFKRAFEDYMKVYHLPADKRGIAENDLPALRRKLFVLGSVADDSKISDQIESSPEFCGRKSDGALATECERLKAIQALGDSGDRRACWTFVDLGDKAAKEVKAAWYANAFERCEKLPNAVLSRVVEDYNKSFPALDAMSQMSVLASVQKSMPKLFDKKIEIVEGNAPVHVRLDDLQRALQKRVRETQGMEKLAGTMLTIPSPEMKIRILARLSKSYDKIANELKKNRIPRGVSKEERELLQKAIADMVTPLQQKAASVGAQGWELAKEAGVKTMWFDELTAQATTSIYADAGEIKWNPTLAYLDGVTENGRKSPWYEALKRKRHRPAVFFYQLSLTPQAEKLALDESDKTLMQMITLRQMGLEAEANLVLKNHAGSLKGEGDRLGQFTKVFQAVISRNFEGVKEARRNYRSGDSNLEEQRILGMASAFEENYTALLAKADAEAKAKAEMEKQKAAEEEEAKKRAPAQAEAKPETKAEKTAKAKAKNAEVDGVPAEQD